MRRSTLLVLPLLFVGLTACAEPGSGSSEEVAALKKQVNELRTELDATAKAAKRTDRQLKGLQDEFASFRAETLKANSVVAAAGADLAEVSDEGGSTAAAAIESVVAGAPEGLADVLQSDEAKDAIKKALDEVNRERDAERRQRWADGMVDRFAQEAQLTDDQTVQMKEIVTKSFTRIGELWSGMRDMGDATPEERAIARQDAMSKMEEIRSETDMEVKAILNSAQYDMYEEQAARMGRGFGGGGGRRR